MIFSLSLVSWLRGLTIPQNINLTIISGKRVKKSVKKRQHKITKTNSWPVLKETINVKKTKSNSRAKTLYSFSDYVKEIAQDSYVNISLRMLKILKSIIFNLSKNITFYAKAFFSLKLIFCTWCLFVTYHCNLRNLINLY